VKALSLAIALLLGSAGVAYAGGSKTFGMFVPTQGTWLAIQLFDSLEECDAKAKRVYEAKQYATVGCREMLYQDMVRTRSARPAPGLPEWQGQAPSSSGSGTPYEQAKQRQADRAAEAQQRWQEQAAKAAEQRAAQDTVRDGFKEAIRACRTNSGCY
jgi:flagellar biosynthesis/type III secretory pathway protein FliH